MRSPGFEPGFSALLFRSMQWRADVLDQVVPSSSDVWTTTAKRKFEFFAGKITKKSGYKTILFFR